MIIFLFICFLGISLLSMMLLYKDNYPYVVIEIYFHFMFVFGRVYDNIRDSMFLYFSYIDDYVIRIILCIMIIFLCVCLGLWVYNIGSLIIVIYIIELGFIYSISFLFVFFGILMYVIILSLFYDHCFWDECI